MPHAKLRITVPPVVWISDVSRKYPDVRFRVLAATANDATGVAEMELLGPDADAVYEEVRECETVTDVTLFDSTPDRCHVEIETTVPLLLSSIQSSGVPLSTPFEVRNGEMVLEERVPQRRLSELGETFDELGISYSVEHVRQEAASETVLTERQRWLTREAIDGGYYDTPRRTTLTDLADGLGMAASTCSEVLHRAEERVMKRFFEDERTAHRETPATAD